MLGECAASCRQGPGHRWPRWALLFLLIIGIAALVSFLDRTALLAVIDFAACVPAAFVAHARTLELSAGRCQIAAQVLRPTRQRDRLEHLLANTQGLDIPKADHERLRLPTRTPLSTPRSSQDSPPSSL